MAVDLEYLSTNPAFAKITGITESVVGRRISEVIPGYCEHNPESLEVFGRVAVTGASTRWEHFLAELNRWFSFTIYSPTPGEVIILADNITEQKQTEIALRENEQRFRSLFENAAVAIMIHDRDSGAILDANRLAIETYGFQRLDELQRNEFWLDPPYSGKDVARLIQIAANKGPQRFEWMSRHQQGRIFWVDVLLNTITLNGIERVLAISIDITARKAAEDSLRLHIEELQRFNRTMVGRELDMIELKQQVNTLSRKLGQVPPYPLDFLGEAQVRPEADQVS